MNHEDCKQIGGVFGLRIKDCQASSETGGNKECQSPKLASILGLG